VTRDALLASTDIDLGRQTLRNFRYLTDGVWRDMMLSANFVEYIPRSRPTSGVNRVTSRVKAEEEIWNKVADEIFGIDKLVRRDKHLRRLSKFIKDVFGIKIVCQDDKSCMRIHRRLTSLRSSDCDVSLLKVFEEKPSVAPLLEFLETKDYLTCPPAQRKKTGWKALKSVVRWRDQIFEVQVQPLENYYLELDHMAGPSHQSFKMVRDRLRDEVAKSVPLYGFYRDLLRMLFLDNSVSFDYENASVMITD
jgi:hypothetical protein